MSCSEHLSIPSAAGQRPHLLVLPAVGCGLHAGMSLVLRHFGCRERRRRATIQLDAHCDEPKAPPVHDRDLCFDVQAQLPLVQLKH